MLMANYIYFFNFSFETTTHQLFILSTQSKIYIIYLFLQSKTTGNIDKVNTVFI